MQIELRDLNCFVQVVRAGSISAAAKNNHLPKATVSHQIRRLEDALGTDLFVRLPRRLELTDEGSRYLSHCRNILAAIEDATDDIKTTEEKLSGRLSVGVASEFGTSTVGQILEEFAHAHPDVLFDVEILSDYQAYFDDPDIDCLIYVGNPPDTSLIGRKIWEFKFGLYAGTKYLENYGAPRSVEELNEHQCIQYLYDFQSRSVQPWELERGRKKATLSPQGRFRSANFWMVKYFTVANLGIAYLPDFFVESEQDIGLVKPVLPEWHSENVPVFTLYPNYRHSSRKVAVFIELWQKKIGDLKSVFPFALGDPGEFDLEP